MNHGNAMKINKTVSDKLQRAEHRASKHINILMHFDDHTLLDKSGKLIQIFKLQGLNYVTASKHDLDQYKNKRNHFLKNLSSEFAIYTWEINQKHNQFALQNSGNHYADLVATQYYEHMNQYGLYKKSCYLALICKPSEGLFQKGLSFIQNLRYFFDKNSKHNDLMKRHQQLNVMSMQLLSSMADYQIQRLAVYQNNHDCFSAPLSFLSQLLNGDTVCVPLAIQTIEPGGERAHDRCAMTGEAGNAWRRKVIVRMKGHTKPAMIAGRIVAKILPRDAIEFKPGRLKFLMSIAAHLMRV